MDREAQPPCLFHSLPRLPLCGPSPLACLPYLPCLLRSPPPLFPRQALSLGLPGCHLSELDLGGNPELGDAGVAPLLAAIKGHPSLAKLNLSSNGLTAKSTPGILALLGTSAAGAGGSGVVVGGRAAAAAGKLPTAVATAAAGKPAGGKTGAATGATAGGGGGGALRDLTLVGNDELPEAVLEQVANWKTKQWALQHGL